MNKVEMALESLKTNVEKKNKKTILEFDEFLTITQESPRKVIRNIFQLFSDMIDNYVGEGEDEYPNDSVVALHVSNDIIGAWMPFRRFREQLESQVLRHDFANHIAPSADRVAEWRASRQEKYVTFPNAITNEDLLAHDVHVRARKRDSLLIVIPVEN